VDGKFVVHLHEYHCTDIGSIHCTGRWKYHWTGRWIINGQKR